MLDYSKLAEEIDKYLESVDENFVKKWLNNNSDSDSNNLSELLSGSKINLNNEAESYQLESSSLDKEDDKFTTDNNVT